jgi:hypothetical protein
MKLRRLSRISWDTTRPARPHLQTSSMLPLHGFSIIPFRRRRRKSRAFGVYIFVDSGTRCFTPWRKRRLSSSIFGTPRGAGRGRLRSARMRDLPRSAGNLRCRNPPPRRSAGDMRYSLPFNPNRRTGGLRRFVFSLAECKRLRVRARDEITTRTPTPRWRCPAGAVPGCGRCGRGCFAAAGRRGRRNTGPRRWRCIACRSPHRRWAAR